MARLPRQRASGPREGHAGLYNKKQSDIAIKLLAIPYDAFADKITAAVPRGKGPDLFIFAQDRVGDWAASEVIEPLGFWVDDELLEAFVDPTLVRIYEYDDALYGLPIAFKMVALFYNKKIVKTPPKTTNELIKMAKAHTERRQQEVRFGLRKRQLLLSGGVDAGLRRPRLQQARDNRPCRPRPWSSR